MQQGEQNLRLLEMADWKALGKVTGEVAFACSHPWWESINLVKHLRADSDGGFIFLHANRFPRLLQALCTREQV